MLDLRQAVAGLVRDGDAVAMEEFTNLIPMEASHEIVRWERRDLTLMRMTPGLIHDQLIGMGCAAKLIFSWDGNPGVGSLHRFRDAVEHNWPRPLELEEHSHAGMANRYVPGGASGLSFTVMRGYASEGPAAVITDLGVLRPDPETKELTLTSLHPGATVEGAREATGWDIRVEELGDTSPPTAEELVALRELIERTATSRRATSK